MYYHQCDGCLVGGDINLLEIVSHLSMFDISVAEIND